MMKMKVMTAWLVVMMVFVSLALSGCGSSSPAAVGGGGGGTTPVYISAEFGYNNNFGMGVGVIVKNNNRAGTDITNASVFVNGQNAVPFSLAGATSQVYYRDMTNVASGTVLNLSVVANGQTFNATLTPYYPASGSTYLVTASYSTPFMAANQNTITWTVNASPAAMPANSLGYDVYILPAGQISPLAFNPIYFNTIVTPGTSCILPANTLVAGQTYCIYAGICYNKVNIPSAAASSTFSSVYGRGQAMGTVVTPL